MKTFLITAVIIVGLLGGVAVATIGMYVSYHNQAVQSEESIVAQYDNGRNVLSNTTTRILEMAQVNEMYRDDLRDIVEATFEGRYGDDGSNSAWQWIQEQNPELDSAVYTNLQATIESGRNEFKTAQTRLLDYRRQYKQSLNQFVSGFFMNLAGFPKIDLDEYDIIVEDGVQGRFDNKKDEVLQIRG